MSTILCPTDFSANAANAIKYTIALNKTLQAKIILLHTFETPMLYSDAVPLTMQLDYKVMHDAAAEKLRSFRKKFFTENDNVEMILVQGLASKRICEIAIEKKADLIIMGATGASAAERILVGSIALRVAKNAHCKVMLIPSKAKFDRFEKIVYATDLSDDNLIHASEIFHIAKIFNSELLFLYVEKEEFVPNDELLQKVSNRIKKFVNYSKKSGYVCTDDSTLDGVTYFLKKNKADCLVMFHRHRNLFQSLYKPSTSKKVSIHTSIPLMIIHQDDYAFQN